MLDGSQPMVRSPAPAPAGPLDPVWSPERSAPADEVVIARGVPRDPRIELAPPDLAWQRMVRWYDPRNLIRSAKKILFSTVIGKYADQRRVAGLGHHRPRFFDYREYGARDARGGLWIDYVADCGDGWDSTYTVARGIGAARLAVGAPPGGEGVTELPRASILVFGGDGVYPVGSRQSYDERLVAPYAAAVHDLPAGDPHPDVFAIPGNHDWYDSLVAFSRKFISGRWFAHWRTLQNRSYFALRLPGRWWLLGTDVQLGSDIDGEQLEYFEHIASHMGEDDRVILCNAEPHWVAAAIAGERDLYHSNNLRDLEARVLKDRTWVYLAGDLHHYRRHTCRSDGRVKITAGGGGAFMHPTHTNLDRIAAITEEVDDERGLPRQRTYELERESCFPPPERSRRVVLMNLLPLGVVWRQPLFFLVPALLYLLTAWMVPLNLGQDSMATDFGTMLDRISSRLLFDSRAAGIWTALIAVGFIMLTPLKHPLCRLAGGLAHALAHMSAVLLCAWLATQLTPGLAYHSAGTYLLRGLLVFGMGGLIGSMIFGWYLTIMCEAFQVHENEATATQGWSHWKSFLRLRIGPDGELTLHPIGIERTPRWTHRGYREGGPRPVPCDGRKDHEIYRYIEPPIAIRAPR